MSGTLHYRLVLRDPADTFDALVLSSHPDDDNPFLTAPPSGDGESLEPLTGKVAFAEYVFQAADAVGTIGDNAEVFRQDFSDYADDAAFLAEWDENAGGSATQTWDLDNTHVVDGETVSAHVNVTGTATVGDIYSVTKTITGLVAGRSYTFARQVWATEIVAGLPANQWNTLTSTLVADGSGSVDLVLRFTTPAGGSFDVDIWFGDVHLLNTETTARVITGLLADSDGKWAGVNRKASWYESTDDGGNWTLIYAGWLIQVTLTGGIKYELHIGDSDRTERKIQAFTRLPSGSGWSGVRLIGGPFDLLGRYPAAWRFDVTAVSGGGNDLPDNTVMLRFDSGWAPEHVDEALVLREDSINNDVANWISAAARPYAQQDDDGRWYFPGLSAVLATTGGTSVGSFTPWGSGGPLELIDADGSVGALPILFGPIGKYLYIQWPTSAGSLPSVDTVYNVTVSPNEASEDTPIWFQGHIVDFVTTLADEHGVDYDSAAAATVKAALGPKSVLYRFTKSEPLWGAFERYAFGPGGFALRRNTAWQWEPFLTRTIPSTEPSETIDEDAIHDPERPILDLGVENVVSAVIWKMRNWVVGADTSDSAPLDRAKEQLITRIYREDDDDGSAGDHALTYDLPGVIYAGDTASGFSEDGHIILSTDGADPIKADSEEIRRRWGRGCPTSEVATLRASGIAAKLGEFVVVDLDHKPTIDTGSTPSGVRGGARICQVTHPTRQPEGRVLRLLDVGTATTNALVPAFTLAQKTGDTRHTAQLTLTNSGDLTGYMVKVQVNTGASEPSGGTSPPLFAPDAVAHDLPLQSAGSTVWARARVVSGDELPGAWSDWDSVALDAVPPVTGLSNAAGANDTERVLTWTVGDASLPVRVRWKATADASYLHSITLPAGSNTYTITGIVPGTAMTAAVDHVEVSPFTGDSSDATTTWTAGSTTPTLTAPTNPQGFTDGNGTYGLRVTASVLPSLTVFMQAVETSVGSGTYGTPVEVGSITSVAGASACVITLTRPNDGLRVQLTAHHAKTGYTDSSDTTAVTLDPWETTATVPVEASDAEFVLASAVPASLPNGRQLAGESGVVDLTDAGAGSTLTVGLVDGGVPLAKLAAGTATDGQVATYDSTNGWQPEAGSAVAVTQATDLAPLWSGGLTESIELVDITTGKLRLEYSVDNGSTWAPLDDTNDTPVVSLEVAGVVRGEWATPDSGFTAATNDVLLRVVALDADGTATELNERLRIWKNPGGIQSARIGCDVLTAGTFSVDPIIGSVFVEFNAAGTTVDAPPDPEPGDTLTDGSDVLPVARGALAWHIADSASNTYTGIGSGNFRVSTLADLSGNGNDLTDAGSAEGPTEPNYVSGGAIATQNGRQPVNYKGNGGYSVWPTDLFDGLTEAELWIVVRAAGGDPNAHFSGLNWNDHCWQLGPGTDVARWARHDSATTDTGGITEDFGSSVSRDLGDAPGSLSIFRIYNVRVASGQFVAALDGSVFYSDTDNTVQFSSAPSMGAANGDIDICEIVLYSNVLTTDERALVLAELQSRWGL